LLCGNFITFNDFFIAFTSYFQIKKDSIQFWNESYTKKYHTSYKIPIQLFTPKAHINKSKVCKKIKHPHLRHDHLIHSFKPNGPPSQAPPIHFRLCNFFLNMLSKIDTINKESKGHEQANSNKHSIRVSLSAINERDSSKSKNKKPKREGKQEVHGEELVA
jgi:hypothetical protein